MDTTKKSEFYYVSFNLDDQTVGFGVDKYLWDRRANDDNDDCYEIHFRCYFDGFFNQKLLWFFDLIGWKALTLQVSSWVNSFRIKTAVDRQEREEKKVCWNWK